MTSMPDDGAPRAFVDLAGDALRYWEFRRLFYNLVLLVVVAVEFLAAGPRAQAALTLDLMVFFFIMAVFANVAYCAVYVVDLFVQFSRLRSVWRQWRWTLLLIGTAFAAAITHFFVLGILSEI